MLNFIEAGRRVRRPTIANDAANDDNFTPASSVRWNAEGSAPRIQCIKMVDSRKIEFSPSSAYIEYAMQLRHGEHIWVFWRRFSEYAKLKRRLSELAPSSMAVRAPLPPKRMTRHAKSHEAIKERADKLEAWLRGVLDEGDDTLLLSAEMLTFIGLGSQPPVGSRPPPLHVSMIHSVAESGDVVLFRTKATVPAIQRAITNRCGGGRRR